MLKTFTNEWAIQKKLTDSHRLSSVSTCLCSHLAVLASFTKTYLQSSAELLFQKLWALLTDLHGGTAQAGDVEMSHGLVLTPTATIHAGWFWVLQLLFSSGCCKWLPLSHYWLLVDLMLGLFKLDLAGGEDPLSLHEKDNMENVFLLSPLCAASHCHRLQYKCDFISQRLWTPDFPRWDKWWPRTELRHSANMDTTGKGDGLEIDPEEQLLVCCAKQ